MMQGQFLFLGTGGSMGIPVIGCRCGVCLSDNIYNQRFRPSGLVTIGDKRLLIDCGPDFRMQALKYKIDRIDGLLLTHAHHDHVAGIDELRIFYIMHRKPIPCLLSKQTALEVQERFSYIFTDPDNPHKLTARLSLQIIENVSGEVTFCDVSLFYMTYEQAGMLVNGFRCGNFAYISDIRHFSDKIYDHLQGVENLVLSALRMTSSPFHFSVDEAIAFSSRVGAKKTWLTHIAHDLDHETTNRYLPSNVRMAYDGLEFSFTV